jgi:hypothetical protein
MYATKSYSRDPVTKVLINRDEKEYKDFKLKMEIFKEINSLKNEVKYLTTELHKTKTSLANLEEKINVKTI